MQKQSPGMSPKRLTQNLLLAFAIILTLVNGSLLRDNLSFKKDNRRLILQNDSLSSVIIELNRNTNLLKQDSLSLNYDMNKQQNRKH